VPPGGTRDARNGSGGDDNLRGAPCVSGGTGGPGSTGDPRDPSDGGDAGGGHRNRSNWETNPKQRRRGTGAKPAVSQRSGGVSRKPKGRKRPDSERT
jgi:hypothetical protein